MSIINKSKKGQSSLEFVLLVGFVILLMGSFLAVIEKNLILAQDDRDQILVDQVVNLFNSELLLAEQSPQGYNRTFFLPLSINGIEYTIGVVNDNFRQDINITYRGRQYVYFRPDNATKIQNPLVITTGQHTIRKECSVFGCEFFIDS